MSQRQGRVIEDKVMSVKVRSWQTNSGHDSHETRLCHARQGHVMVDTWSCHSRQGGIMLDKVGLLWLSYCFIPLCTYSLVDMVYDWEFI